MLAAVKGSDDTANKPLREPMATAGCAPPDIGYNEVPALIR